MEILVSKDTKGKVRVVKIWYEWDDSQRGFVIRRITSQYGGKETVQPEIWIYKGKAKRTVTEQCKLEFNSHIKKYLDKGYKELPSTIDFSDKNSVEEFIGGDKTNQDGILKPMLAKQADKVASSVFNKNYYGSRKINGVRCLIYYKDGEVRTSSRGAINYDLAIFHIISHPKLEKFFKDNPDTILDGEIYKHGWTLNKISGLCRTQSTVSDGEPLEFYMYDIVRTDLPFSSRLEIMEQISETLELGDFNPYREWEKGELKIQMVPQESMTGWLAIKSYHDKYVKEGWEGLVIRNVDDVYGPGKRTNAMIKIKEYQEAEYEITGLSEGLRDEDLCFTMKTPSGLEFKAKPMGDRSQKQWYRNHIDELVGKMGTIKYFEMSGAGTDIPQQPIFICVRDYE